MKKTLMVIIFWGMVCSVVVSAQAPQEKKLTLKDAIYYALENNLGLQVQKARTQVAQLNFQISRAQLYLPTLTVNSSYDKSKQPSTDIYQGVDSVEEKSFTQSLGISQQTPFGGIFSLDFSASRETTNVVTETFDPKLDTSLTASLSQPLLQNFGALATNYQIYIAANDHKISKHQLEEAIVNLVYDVESAYWELVFAHQNLDAAKTALERAKDLLKQNEVKVKVGTAAPIEILSSKANVARNESTVIQAEQAIRTREEALKRILNMSKDPFPVIPGEGPEIKDVPIDFEAFLKEALENRTDMKRAKINLESSGLTVKYRRNQALPNLLLDASYESTGVGGTTWDFTTNNPFDPDFQRFKTEETSFKDTINEIFKLKNTVQGISLNLQTPIPFTAGRAQLAQAKIERERALLEFKEVENTVFFEVKEAIKELESNRKLVDADKIALELAGETLKAEEKKLSVGLSTNFNVLQYQQQYAAAQTQLLRSTIDYVLTQARIKRTLNRTFKAYDIKVDDGPGK